MVEEALKHTELSGLAPARSGKVRDIFDLEDKLLIVSTDRISCFDVVLQDGIPAKGKVLTGLSLFWFDFLKDVIPNHLLSADVNEFPPEFQKFTELLSGRSMLVKKAKPLPVECIVRGYLSGSGWKEYRQKQSVCGIGLPAGLRQSDKLPEIIFTPSTKAEVGHDQNIDQEYVEKLIGKTYADKIRRASIGLYKKASEYAQSKGIILADTKFEFGMHQDQLILIDEVLTPDSSRFWPSSEYLPGRTQPSFDKQFVRDYLETLDWNKQPPAPKLPPEIIKKTTAKYLEAYKRLIGRNLEGF